jgi:hypothetical protein
MGKPRKWSKRKWVDVFSGPQFRTYSSPRKFQLCLTIESYQGDGVFHFSVHLMNRALAFEFPYEGNRPNPGIHWVLFKGKRT